MEEFRTIKEKKAFFQNKKFNTTPGFQKIVPNNNTSSTIMFREDKHALHAISEAIANHPFNATNIEECVQIPFFTNDISPINVFEQVKNVKTTLHDIPLSKLLLTLAQAAIEANIKPIEDVTLINANRLLLRFDYPITMNDDNTFPNFNWTTSIIQHDMFIEIIVFDPILYYLVDKFSVEAKRPMNTKSLYILGGDVFNENQIIRADLIKQLFFEVGKAMFISSLLKKEQDLLGLTDVPAHYFGFGSYTLNNVKSLNFYRTTVGKDLLHVVPLWEVIFPFSYSYELTSLKIQYSFQTSSLLSHYLELKNQYLPQKSTSSINLDIISSNVVLSMQGAEHDPFIIYQSNIKVRDRLSSNLDHVKNFDQVKSKIYPNVRVGAVTKLIGLESHLPKFSDLDIIDVGAAPGTWTKHFILSKAKSVTSISRSNYGDLKMRRDIINLIEQSDNHKFISTDAVMYLESMVDKYDIIASDMATQKPNYYTQSINHNQLALSVLESYDKLKNNGFLICKIYDLTTEILDQLITMAPFFENITIVKPYGSCLTNNEQYIICKRYNPTPQEIDRSLFINVITKQALSHIYSQMHHLQRLINLGFGKSVTYSPIYTASKLVVNDLRQTPIELQILLQKIKFSNQLFTETQTGMLIHETTNLNDKYLRIQWDVPKIPLPNYIYIQETNIGYGVGNVNLSDLVVFHVGFILQDNVKKSFILLDRHVARIFSKKYEDLYITDTSIHGLHKMQFIFDILKEQESYNCCFSNLHTYGELVNGLRYLSLNFVIECTRATSGFGVYNTMTQFFRESANLTLLYKTDEDGFIVTRSKRGRPIRQLDLSLFADQKLFTTMYFDATTSGKTTRQAFTIILNQYSIKIPYCQLIQTSICYANPTYIEHQTGQICISQPSCIQLRRSLFV